MNDGSVNQPLTVVVNTFRLRPLSSDADSVNAHRCTGVPESAASTKTALRRTLSTPNSYRSSTGRAFRWSTAAGGPGRAARSAHEIRPSSQSRERDQWMYGYETLPCPRRRRPRRSPRIRRRPRPELLRRMGPRPRDDAVPHHDMARLHHPRRTTPNRRRTGHRQRLGRDRHRRPVPLQRQRHHRRSASRDPAIQQLQQPTSMPS